MPSKLENLGKMKESWVILALDYAISPNTLGEWRKLLQELSSRLAGVKIGLPAFLRLGPQGVSNLIEDFGNELYFLADFKLADIEDVVTEELNILEEIGFDGAIIHLFPHCITKPLRTKLEVFGLVSMTCTGSLVDEHSDNLAEYAASLGIKGVVVGATKPERIRKVREKLKQVLILSPGVGVQGAPPGSAIRAGADFEIVGRAVVLSPDPSRELERIVEAQRVARYAR